MITRGHERWMLYVQSFSAAVLWSNKPSTNIPQWLSNSLYKLRFPLKHRKFFNKYLLFCKHVLKSSQMQISLRSIISFCMCRIFHNHIVKISNSSILYFKNHFNFHVICDNYLFKNKWYGVLFQLFKIVLATYCYVTNYD